ncbi:response regulator [uncultured Desulfosarcina sp.]|uniref:response regulator n=1 Tax=uncultured Desulfosarcina sp. TaxID=218289 RepID=UPI0029C83F90|nr:response regulator [uncultured Desulfosarcina sp.]
MCNILVIDDDRMVRSLVRHVLKQHDYAVETATDGRAGIAKFDSGRYDLVITDVRMPGADGHQVASHIKNSEHRETPVIGMSATPWNLNDHCFDAVLPKPFGIDNLMEITRSLTAGRCQPGSYYASDIPEDSVNPQPNT